MHVAKLRSRHALYEIVDVLYQRGLSDEEVCVCLLAGKKCEVSWTTDVEKYTNPEVPQDHASEVAGCFRGSGDQNKAAISV